MKIDEIRALLAKDRVKTVNDKNKPKKRPKNVKSGAFYFCGKKQEEVFLEYKNPKYEPKELNGLDWKDKRGLEFLNSWPGYE